MKILQSSIWCLILMTAPLKALATTYDAGGWKGKYTKERKISKEYEVSPTALLKVTNSYGNLNITSWNEDRVVIEVHIKTNGDDEQKVTERLNEIDVDFESNIDLVSAATRFGDRKRNWNWNWGKRNSVNVQVNYTIKLPVKNSVYLNNDYGNVFLDRIDGHAKIKCDYGKMEIGELRGRNNELRFDYTTKSSFDYINSAIIHADYSNFNIAKCGDLTIRADYTNAQIDEMGNLDYASDYGSIEVESVKNVSGKGSYISVKLGQVTGNLMVSSDYGSIKISEMVSGNIDLKSDYTGIKIGYAPEYSFDFEITTEYAGVSGKDDFEIAVSKEKSNQKYYQGYRGASNSGNLITINSSYGGVSFTKN